MVTGPNHPFAELRNQNIKPYTDLLLHDLGPDLADSSAVTYADAGVGPGGRFGMAYAAALGDRVAVHGQRQGGVASRRPGSIVLEAVLWHGGEAEAASQRVTKLSTADRDALLAFVNSL